MVTTSAMANFLNVLEEAKRKNGGSLHLTSQQQALQSTCLVSVLDIV